MKTFKWLVMYVSTLPAICFIFWSVIMFRDPMALAIGVVIAVLVASLYFSEDDDY